MTNGFVTPKKRARNGDLGERHFEVTNFLRGRRSSAKRTVREARRDPFKEGGAVWRGKGGPLQWCIKRAVEGVQLILRKLRFYLKKKHVQWKGQIAGKVRGSERGFSELPVTQEPGASPPKAHIFWSHQVNPLPPKAPNTRLFFFQLVSCRPSTKKRDRYLPWKTDQFPKKYQLKKAGIWSRG